MEEVICIDSSFDESNDVLSQDVKELVTHRESLADTNPNKSSLHVMKADSKYRMVTGVTSSISPQVWSG